MSGKSKESGQKENIKTGVIAITAIIVMVIITSLIVTKISYNAFVPITYTTTSNFKGMCLTAYPNLELTQQECMADAYQQCKELHPLWEYPTNTADICYKQCMRDARSICSWAHAKYPNYKR